MEIRIRTPADVLEASRALQAANRAALDARNQDGTAQRSAARVARNALRFAESQISRAAGGRDPWKGAVPEFEPIPPTFARRFGKQLAHATVSYETKYELSYSFGYDKETPVERKIKIWTGKRNASLTKTYGLLFATEDRISSEQVEGEPYTVTDPQTQRVIQLREYKNYSDTVVVENNFDDIVFTLPAGKDKSIVVIGFVGTSSGTNEQSRFRVIQAYNEETGVWQSFYQEDDIESLYTQVLEDTDTFINYTPIRTEHEPVAFLCSPAEIKEITVQGTLLDIMESWKEDAEGTGLQDYLFEFDGPGADRTFTPGPTRFNGDYVTSYIELPTAPDAFESLYGYCVANDITPFVTENELKTFDPARKKLRTDTVGANSTVKGFYENGNQQRLLYYMYETDIVDQFKASPALRFRVDPAAPVIRDELDESNANYDPDELGGYTINYRFNVHPTWDWFDHAYCRAMCLALGFTEQDLTFAPPP
jgi:hypothetical protein